MKRILNKKKHAIYASVVCSCSSNLESSHISANNISFICISFSSHDHLFNNLDLSGNVQWFAIFPISPNSHQTYNYPARNLALGNIYIFLT